MTSQRPARLEEIDRWWGGPGWADLKGLTQIEIATGMARRFQKELGYRFAHP
jgi:hypothetical protein